jgi:carboxymethylenebutenolidase
MTGPRDILTETVEITVDDGTTMSTYLARPATSGPHAGVIVAPELFGISAHVRDVCERIAGLGYRALALDLHHRTAPNVELAEDDSGRARGFALLQQMTRPNVLSDVRAVMEHVRADGPQPVGMVGLSVGGHVAYLAATELDLAAVAVLYGGWIPTTDIPLSQPEPTLTRTPHITARMLLMVGSDDHIILAEHRQATTAALQDAGVRHELVEYLDVPHGFFSQRRGSYHAQAAADAWSRIEALLAEELR